MGESVNEVVSTLGNDQLTDCLRAPSIQCVLMARQQARERISRRLGTDLGLKGLRAARGKGGLARRPSL